MPVLVARDIFIPSLPVITEDRDEIAVSKQLDLLAQIDQHLDGARRIQSGVACYTTDVIFDDAKFSDIRSHDLRQSHAQSPDSKKRKGVELDDEAIAPSTEKTARKHTTETKERQEHVSQVDEGAAPAQVAVEGETYPMEITAEPMQGKRPFRELSAEGGEFLSWQGGSKRSATSHNMKGLSQTFSRIPDERAYLWAPSGPESIFGRGPESLLPPFPPPPPPFQLMLDLRGLQPLTSRFTRTYVPKPTKFYGD